MKKVLIAVVLISFSQTPLFAGNASSWENDDSWIVFVSLNKDLYDEIQSLASRVRKNTMSPSQARKLEKTLMKHSPEDRVVMERMFNHIRQRFRFDDPIYDGYKGHFGYESTHMEEVVVFGRMFDQFPIDPAEFSYDDITMMRGLRATANALYREGEYDEAFPLLLELAKRGFKDSQSRLAYILFIGTETVEKSNLRALGWLGTAAHGESEPMFRVLFKRYMRQVPESVRPTVDTVLAGYREQFDSSAYVDCTTNHRFSKGIVKRTYCQFDLEAQVEACLGLRCSSHKVNARDEGV